MKILAVVLLAQGTFAQVPPDAEIRKILAERIDTHRQSVGIVVGVIEPQGRRIVAYGGLAKNDPRPLNGDTVFEIGSITKVFTSLLLAGMVERGEVALNDPVAKYLPATVLMPERDGRQITLQDLATHTSGLPRMPTNFSPKDPGNPYVDYSVERLYEFLSRHQLRRDVGSLYEYSNLGVGLLGQALASRAGMDYEELVRSRILQPLRMDDTSISLTPEMKSRLATGFGYENAKVGPVSNWDLGAFAGAGGLRSTVNDMLTFLAVNLGYTETPLAPAMAAMLKVRRPVGHDIQALGWYISTPGFCMLFHCWRKDNDIVNHNGGTGGYQSFIGYDAKTRVGVVVLSNAGYGAGMDDIGMHLLNPKVKLLNAKALPIPRDHTEIAIDPNMLDAFVGRYRFPDSDIWTVRREGSRLFVKNLAEPEIEVYPESERDFFLKIADAQITFKSESPGRATELIVRQAWESKAQRAKRIE